MSQDDVERHRDSGLDHEKLRADLLYRLSHGELSRREAEAEVGRLGLPPLIPVVNPEDWDPRSEVFWTLPMTLAWIMTRDWGAVRDMWPLYREKHLTWLAVRRAPATAFKYKVSTPGRVSYYERRRGQNRLAQQTEIWTDFSKRYR
jgi:hypothetical protein